MAEPYWATYGLHFDHLKTELGFQTANKSGIVQRLSVVQYLNGICTCAAKNFAVSLPSPEEAPVMRIV